MGTVTLPYTLTAGQPENVNQLMSNLTTLRDALNGNIDATNLASGAVDVAELASTLAAFLGVTQSGTVRRGKSIIATEESTASASYTTLTTPDRVSNVVLPTDGLIAIAYKALWKGAASGTQGAAIFIGANQLKASLTSGAPPVQQVFAPADAAPNYNHLATFGAGLDSTQVTSADATSDVTTGQIVGTMGAQTSGNAPCGVCYVFAAAGTYDVSVQFKSSAGSVFAKERKLWVWTMGF